MRSKEKSNDKMALYFLAWQDCIDRLDILLLEARHIQQNIIYNLRSPLLYRPLRYEEKFLWDKDAFCTERLTRAVEKEGCDTKTITDKLASEAILLYPLPKHEKLSALKEGFGLKEKLETQLDEFVENMLLKSKWSTDQRRHYHNLYALQKMKRNIFSDKLMVFQEGFYAFGIFPKKRFPEEKALPRFMVLRSAILRRVWDYISRMGDHQEEFSKSLDMGLQDHPRPSMERRREQRIYTTYLSQRCLDMWLEIKMLMDEKLDKGNKKKLGRPSLLHRWQHDFTSNSHSFFDDVADTIGREDKKLSPYSHYINTSYFMPERPNLQSLIAHEVAHSFLKDYLDDLPRQELNLREGSFYSLVKQLAQCLEVYNADRLLENPSSYPLVKEIVVDLLACSIKGPAYLYALFLDITGTGLEKLFIRGKYDEIELKLYDYLEGAAGQYDQERDWYIRLHVICAWLHAIFDKYNTDLPRTKLVVRLIEGIQSVLDEMVDYLDDIARPSQKWGQYWKSLKDRMSILVKQSEAPGLVRERWEERNKDYYDEGARLWPVYTNPLNRRVQQYVLRCFAAKKFEFANFKLADEAFGNLKETLENKDVSKNIMDKLENLLKEGGIDWNEDEFMVELKKSADSEGAVKIYKHAVRAHCTYLCKKIYNIEPDAFAYWDEKKSGKEILFANLYDIPWQSSFLDGLECVHKLKEESSKRIDWINRLHLFPIASRKIYQIALDFLLSDTDSHYLRLREVVRLLTDKGLHNKLNQLRNLKVMIKVKGKDKNVIDLISQWLKEEDFHAIKGESLNENEKLEGELEELSKDIDKFYNNKQPSLKKLAEKHRAHLLLKATYRIYEPRKKRILSRIILDKLIMLHRDIKNLGGEKGFEILKPLISYLNIVNLKTQDLQKTEDKERRPNNLPFSSVACQCGRTVCSSKWESCLDPIPKRKPDFFTKVINAMSEDEQIPVSIRQYAIGRVSIGSAYRLHEDEKFSISLTKESLDKLNKTNLPPKITKKLQEDWKNRKYEDKENYEDAEKKFVQALEKTIGKNDMKEFKSLILEHAKISFRLTEQALEKEKLPEELKELINVDYKSECEFRNALEKVIGERHIELIPKILKCAKETKKNKFPVDNLFQKGFEDDVEKNVFRMKSLLGRYDFIIYGPTRKQGHHWLPLFEPLKQPDQDKKARCSHCLLEADHYRHGETKLPQCEVCSSENGFIKSYPQFEGELPPEDEENFLPFFVRWEYAAPIRLRNESWKEANKNSPIAFISIVLKRSAFSRLYFLYRLLCVSQKNFDAKKEEPLNLEELKGYFRDGDRAFLSDGWEDVLIMFSGDSERLENIFKIQKVLFEDFQIERTELILTPEALNYVFLSHFKLDEQDLKRMNLSGDITTKLKKLKEYKSKNGFETALKELLNNEITDEEKELILKDALKSNARKIRIEVLYRVTSDLGLTKEFDAFVNTFKEHIKNIKNTEKSFPFKPVLSRIPGRMDYLLWLYPPEPSDKKQNSHDQQKPMYRTLINLLCDTKVDRVQTNLGWKENIFDNKDETT